MACHSFQPLPGRVCCQREHKYHISSAGRPLVEKKYLKCLPPSAPHCQASERPEVENKKGYIIKKKSDSFSPFARTKPPPLRDSASLLAFRRH